MLKQLLNRTTPCYEKVAVDAQGAQMAASCPATGESRLITRSDEHRGCWKHTKPLSNPEMVRVESGAFAVGFRRDSRLSLSICRPQ
jgi:hypothetical protein